MAPNHLNFVNRPVYHSWILDFLCSERRLLKRGNKKGKEDADMQSVRQAGGSRAARREGRKKGGREGEKDGRKVGRKEDMSLTPSNDNINDLDVEV